VDLLIETASWQLTGIEVGAAATVTASDARHLTWLRDQTGDAFRAAGATPIMNVTPENSSTSGAPLHRTRASRVSGQY
jgi:hypothetical protein